MEAANTVFEHHDEQADYDAMRIWQETYSTSQNHMRQIKC
ncbi:MAG: hypothetical protein Ct9H90mP16_22210 [Candidatus Poseidoniales archaeon]|nr:MAG: hypothetical protein Ct9H90mP16_22210 [Candidatus Poseidoniales archaeon]